MDSTTARMLYPIPAHVVPGAAGAPQPSDVIAPGKRFHYCELQVLQREGVLRQLYGSAFLPCDVRERPEHRAVAMSLSLPANLRSRLLLGRLSSAWVYTGAACPPRVTALLDHRRRSGSLPPFSQLQVHEVRLGKFDEWRLGTVRLTSPLRTAVDLLFQPEGPPDWPSAEQALREMLARPELGVTLSVLRQALATRPRAPFRRRAEDRLDQLSQPPTTMAHPSCLAPAVR